jgi:hypothetical protein
MELTRSLLSGLKGMSLDLLTGITCTYWSGEVPALLHPGCTILSRRPMHEVLQRLVWSLVDPAESMMGSPGNYAMFDL